MRANARGLKVPEESYQQYRTAARAMSLRAFLRIGRELLGFRVPTGLAGAGRSTFVVAGEREHPLVHQSLRALVAALPEAQGRMPLGSAAAGVESAPTSSARWSAPGSQIGGCPRNTGSAGGPATGSSSAVAAKERPVRCRSAPPA